MVDLHSFRCCIIRMLCLCKILKEVFDPQIVKVDLYLESYSGKFLFWF